jgi:hypothetical protein
MIVAAVVAGAITATKDVAALAVKDGYAGLKALIVRKFGADSDVVDAVNGVEKKPDSKGRQETLKEELEAAQAGQDAEVVQQAGALLDLLKEHEPSYYAQLHGSGAIAQGEGAVAAGERGVAVGGDVTGSTIVTGDSNVVGGQTRMGDKGEEAE